MRVLVVAFVALAPLLNCGVSSGDAAGVDSKDSTCDIQRQAAREGFNEGRFTLPETRSYLYGLYVEEAFYVLFKVKPSVPLWNDVVGLPPSCYDIIIDSLITAKFGKNAFERAQNYADSLHAADPMRYGNECFYSPTYIPNNDSLNADLRKVVHYPPVAIRDSISGVVYVRLEIDSTGSVSKASVVKGVRPDVDSAAVDGASKLGKFRIERRWGVKQAGQVTIPIRFVLE